MPDRAFGRRAVLEGRNRWDRIASRCRRRRRRDRTPHTTHNGVRPRAAHPAASEVSVVPGSTLLFELEAPVGFDPGDVEWGGEVRPAAGTPLATDYEYAAGVPATFRTFDSPGTHRVTAMYGANESTAWTVRRPRRRTTARDRSPIRARRRRAGRRRRPRDVTAESSARDRTLERLVWVEGQNMTVPDVTDLEGETDSATLVREPPGWTSAGYPTSAIAVSETGVLSDAASVDGPEIRPPLAVRIVETNDPVLAGETRGRRRGRERRRYDDDRRPDPGTRVRRRRGPEVVGARTVAVDWPETERVSFAFETYPVDHDDRFPVRVVGADDADERTVEVVARDGSDPGTGVDVTIVRTNAPVRAGEPLEVVAEVATAGTEQVSREVTLVVGHDPETVDSTTVALEAGERETVRLGYRTYPRRRRPSSRSSSTPATVRTSARFGCGDGRLTTPSVSTFDPRPVSSIHCLHVRFPHLRDVDIERR
ncbi:hypothetical protein D8S78_04195 [Natrialba swarupiae]|nr:hypothetical protein [Natrialba swarupiae]